MKGEERFKEIRRGQRKRVAKRWRANDYRHLEKKKKEERGESKTDETTIAPKRKD